MKIDRVKNITDYNINDLHEDTILIFDIDDTLLKYDDHNGFSLTDNNLPMWLHQAYLRGHPIICLTARYTPNDNEKKLEEYVFKELGLYPLISYNTTRHSDVKIINYTNANYKGPFAMEILQYYRKIGYYDYVFFEIDLINYILFYLMCLTVREF